MRILDQTPITDAAEMPVKKGTLKFLQDAYTELSTAILTALLSPAYNPSTMYVLYGVRNTAVAPFYNISPGAVFYQGEVFYVDAITFTAMGANVGIFQIGISQYTVDADPVTFTDTTLHNVHNIRKMQVLQGASGTGLSNFSSAFYLNFTIPAQLNLTAGVAVPHSDNLVQLSGVYPNLDLYVPASGNLNPSLKSGTVHIGDVPPGGTTIPINFTGGSLPLGTQYFAMVTLVSEGGSPHDDTTCWCTIIRASMNETGFQIRLQEGAGLAQSLSADYIIFKK